MLPNYSNNDVPPGCECPVCGERDADCLVWQEDDETVRCDSCGAKYHPHTEVESDDDAENH